MRSSDATNIYALGGPLRQPRNGARLRSKLFVDAPTTVLSCMIARQLCKNPAARAESLPVVYLYPETNDRGRSQRHC
jgi:hypothetical protein